MTYKNKGSPLYKTSCSECGSSDANQVFVHEDGGEDSYCFACQSSQPLNNNRGRVGKVMQDKQHTEAQKLSQIASLPQAGFRGIHKGVIQLFGVRIAYSESDNTVITDHYYPYVKDGVVSGYNNRKVLAKGFYTVGDRKGSIELFGQALAKKNGSKRLYITEGECDAMALYQVIVDNTPDKYKQFKPCVVSLTKGSQGGLKDLINNRAFLDNYQEVVLVLDNDTAGLKAKKDILKTFHNFKTADLPLKDANDMLEAGRGKELYQAVMWDSKVVRQGEVVEVTDELVTQALARPVMGLSTPWPSLDKLTYGIRPSTIVILGAAPKQGKSEFKNQLVHHIATKHSRKVGVYDLEVHPIKTLKQVASKEAKTNFLRPDNKYDEGLLKVTLDKFKGKLYLYDRTGSRDWEDIRIAIEEQYLLDGVCEFFLDPLTALISRFSSSEANDKLNEIMTDMADLVNKYPITIFAFSHLNPKPRGSKSHEEGAKVLSNELTGSRSMERWSSLGLGIERNRSDDCPQEERDHSKVVILYDRDYGNYGSVGMFYNKETTEYLEPPMTVRRV